MTAAIQRFYQEVVVASQSNGWTVALDGKPLKTQAGQVFAHSARGFADVIAAEWEAQEAQIDLASMPMTRLAFALMEMDAAVREQFIAHVMAYLETELLCYRDGQQQALCRQQVALWDPWLMWFHECFGVRLVVTDEVMPVLQPAENAAIISGLLDRYSDEALLALYVLVGVFGSLVLAIACVERMLSAEEAMGLSALEYAYQMERWGVDKEVEMRQKAAFLEAESAIKFLYITDG